MAEFTASINVGFNDFASGPMAEFRRTLLNTNQDLHSSEIASLRAGDAMEEMAGATRIASADVAAASRAGGESFERMGGSADQWADDYRSAAREVGLSTDLVENDLARMAREADRSADRMGGSAAQMASGVRRAGDQTGDSTGFMQRAWRGLDVIDDIGGVIGMVDGLTSGLREMMTQAIEASRTVESELNRLASIDLEAAPETLAARREWADAFATQRGGLLSELVAITTPELIGLTSDAEGGGLRGTEAQRAAELAAGMSRLPGAGAPEQSMDALMRMSLFADPAQEMGPQLEAWADQVAEAQRVFYVSSLSDLNEAISSAVGTAQAFGLDEDVFLGSLGAFHRITSGSEAGEALNSVLEEMVGGMRELGLDPALTDAGKLDYRASLERLRTYRTERADLSDVDWTALLMERFGELGGRELGNLTGALWEEFSAGMPQIAAADDADMLTTRLLRMADDRNLRVAQISAAQEVVAATVGDENKWLDDLQLSFRYAAKQGYIDTGGVLGGVPEGVPSTLRERREMLASGGKEIPETLAQGVTEGGPALGAAMEGMLNREVTPRLAQSDAEVGAAVTSHRRRASDSGDDRSGRHRERRPGRGARRCARARAALAGRRLRPGGASAAACSGRGA